MSRYDGSRLTKSPEQLRAAAIEAAAADMTAIFEVLGKATCIQQPHPELTERLPLANLVTQAAGASGIVAVAANRYDHHYARLEFEATEYEYEDGAPVRGEVTSAEAERIFAPYANLFQPNRGVGPRIRRRHREPEIESAVPRAPGDVVCLRCGLPMSRHQPGQDLEDEATCPDA